MFDETSGRNGYEAMCQKIREIISSKQQSRRTKMQPRKTKKHQTKKSRALQAETDAKLAFELQAEEVRQEELQRDENVARSLQAENDARLARQLQDLHRDENVARRLQAEEMEGARVIAGDARLARQLQDAEIVQSFHARNNR